ncbi:putative membrane protein [Sulfurospirillum diekertiae]|uniref:Protoporphyrinogen IX oxidase n=1 Tax=Sulfurospirillum diekertiae TaxID=1854492 RepID=A0A290HVB4_9BACT|nr:CopD family protein [Sulfurospirillum diekertiae]ATB69776.1 putative membrane protein [Sulfurospirillum diekertiae]
MNSYSLVLAFHVISIATWMIMLVYLPKLFVYHINAPRDAQAVVALQEASLYKVGTIAMIFSITFGLILLYLNPSLLQSGGWLHLKLTLATFMVIYHFTCKRFINQFANEDISNTMRFFRFFRVIPEITTSLIILLTIIKPF